MKNHTPKTFYGTTFLGIGADHWLHNRKKFRSYSSAFRAPKVSKTEQRENTARKTCTNNTLQKCSYKSTHKTQHQAAKTLQLLKKRYFMAVRLESPVHTCIRGNFWETAKNSIATEETLRCSQFKGPFVTSVTCERNRRRARVWMALKRDAAQMQIIKGWEQEEGGEIQRKTPHY